MFKFFKNAIGFASEINNLKLLIKNINIIIKNLLKNCS